MHINIICYYYQTCLVVESIILFSKIMYINAIISAFNHIFTANIKSQFKNHIQPFSYSQST